MATGMKNTARGVTGLVLAFAGCLMFAYQTSAAITYHKVAVTGDIAPGTDTGSFASFEAPVINAAGQTAFKAGYSGTTGGSGLWSEGTGSLGLVAKEGDPAPGTEADTVFSYSFFNPIINDNGSTLFLSTLSGPSIINDDLTTLNNAGLWSDRSGALDLVVRRSGPAPGMEPDRYFVTTNFHTTFNNDGYTAFYGETRGEVFSFDSNTGVWSESSGSLALIAREGDQPPGTEPGEVYGHLLGIDSDIWQNPSLNDVGQIVFYGQLKGPELHPHNEAGLWSDASGTMELIVRTGTQAPGTEPGVLFQSSHPAIPRFTNPRINNSGDISFFSLVSGPGVSLHGGIWTHSDDTLRLVARDGDPVAALPGDITFQRVGMYPLLNGRGQVVFDSTLAGTDIDEANDRGIWLEDHGALTMIAREGDHAPGTDPDQLFAEISDYATNGAGQVVFLSSLTGPGIDASNDSGLWATSPNSELTLIVREGDLIDIDEDPYVEDLRPIGSFSILGGSGGEDGRASCFNDLGQIAVGGVWGVFVFETRLPGDLDGDGFVGINDLNAILPNWNQSVSHGDPLAGDTNGDGFVGIEDLNAVLGSWNTGTPPGLSGDSAVIPEPGVGMVVVVGLLRAMHRRRPAC
jgi:hypothetical protein